METCPQIDTIKPFSEIWEWNDTIITTQPVTLTDNEIKILLTNRSCTNISMNRQINIDNLLINYPLNLKESILDSLLCKELKVELKIRDISSSILNKNKLKSRLLFTKFKHSYPDSDFGESCHLNDDSYCIMSRKYGLYQYNATYNIYQHLFNNQQLNISKDTVSCCDTSKNNVYIYNSIEKSLSIINTKRLTINKINDTIKTGNGSKIIFFNQTLHLMGGDRNKKHFVYIYLENVKVSSIAIGIDFCSFFVI